MNGPTEAHTEFEFYVKDEGGSRLKIADAVCLYKYDNEHIVCGPEP